MKHWTINTRFLLDYYDAWLRTDKLHEVYNALGLHKAQLEKYEAKNPELLEAKQLAQERRKEGQYFQQFVVGRLSPEARECYEKIQFWSQHTDAAYKIDAILSGKTKQLKQELFVHCLAANNYDVNESCRLCGINGKTLNEWRENDYEFRMMVSEIEFMQKNFIEQSLFDLVKARHPGSVLFANKTRNRDRGYGELVQHEHSGTIQHAALNIDELNLSVECRRELLTAIRAKQTAQKDANTKLLAEKAAESVQEAELVLD